MSRPVRWLDPGGHALATTARIPYEIPEFWGAVHWGFPIGVVLTIVVAAAMNFTRWGYEVRIAGSNPQAARYAGMPFRRHLITVMLLSGAISGIAGMFEVAGTVHRLQGGISNNFGYLGIMVAVLARGSALGVLAGAALMAVILNSGIILQTEGLNVSTVLAITGLILFFTAIGDGLRPLPRHPHGSDGLGEPFMDIITGLLQTSILAGGVLALAALGEVLAERVGVVNLGVEGLMSLGAVTGIATVVQCRFLCWVSRSR